MYLNPDGTRFKHAHQNQPNSTLATQEKPDPINHAELFFNNSSWTVCIALFPPNYVKLGLINLDFSSSHLCRHNMTFKLVFCPKLHLFMSNFTKALDMTVMCQKIYGPKCLIQRF